MSDPEIPSWLRSLPRAPEYRPTETEFADPIAFISRIEREAAAFGICKVIPPLPKPSKRFVLANLNRSLSKSPDLSSSAAAAAPAGGAVPGAAAAAAAPGGGADPAPAPAPASAAVFTTRHQELGTRRARTPVPFHKQVWQSGELYSVEQFEAKSKAFARAQLGGFKEVTPLLVESLFWKAAAEKPIYVEYANDVPGSGFAAPEEPFKYYTYRRRRRKREFHQEKIQEPMCPLPVGSDVESTGSAGWKLSNSPWNLQVIARSPGSLTRFMPDEVPGVTSPMVYIAMLFSWFAWHVEDHELHSLNFLHMGAPKTWYAIPGDHAAALEEIVRVQGYGGNVDRLAALAMLGGKTTLLSPEVLVASGIPCCRLVQNPGEFVVTFPRAYHIGFSHGFNCGEAANFATPQWLKFAKDAAVRRAAMNYLPMLSHQQLLYMLTVSFISRVPGELLPGVRTSRLRDRKKEEREFLIKRAFLHDMMNENQLLCSLHAKESTMGAVLWEPDLLPSSCLVPHERMVDGDSAMEMIQCKLKNSKPLENVHEGTDHLASIQSQNILSVKTQINACDAECSNSKEETINYEDAEGEADEEDLPFGLRIDSGSLACVACGILGYPFMAILQPSEKALNGLSPVNCEESTQKIEVSECTSQPSLASIIKKFDSAKESSLNHVEARDLETSDGDKARIGHQSLEGNTCRISSSQIDSPDGRKQGCSTAIFEHPINQLSHQNDTSSPSRIGIVSTEDDISNMNISGEKAQTDADRLLGAGVGQCDEVTKWNTHNGFLRPRIFCLQHALEIEELLQSKGSAHVLIICHSDYLTIKALAMSIAEEIDVQLDCEDIPLQNASPSDMHLINISIDDEEHEEDGKDWSSSLGVNLQYRAKLRKQSSAKEQLALSLGGIFSDPAPVSVVSNLKWLCKKSRTPCKVVGTSLPRSHLHKDTNKFGRSHCYYENVDEGNMNNLYAVPITIAEHLQINQLGLSGQSVSSSHEVTHSLNSQGSPVDDNTDFVSGGGELEIHSDKSVNTVTLSNPMSSESDISYYNIPIWQGLIFLKRH
uniref:Lysine-specific demethylase ELF6 n=1 Tax=Ananas comosus var. bracteatus TaxID=296719 RepID=A0A6V7PZ50_ANACO|nr:unnamed protein product [Ananas comosus var. bracteatus]